MTSERKAGGTFQHLAKKRLESCISPLGRDTGLEPREAAQKLDTARTGGSRELLRQQDVRSRKSWKFEGCRKNSHHLDRATIKDECASSDCRITSEAAEPKAVSYQRHTSRARLVIRGAEVASGGHGKPENTEQVSFYGRAREALRPWIR